MGKKIIIIKTVFQSLPGILPSTSKEIFPGTNIENLESLLYWNIAPTKSGIRKLWYIYPAVTVIHIFFW